MKKQERVEVAIDNLTKIRPVPKSFQILWTASEPTSIG